MKKWKCTECETVISEDKLLIGQNPFAEKNIIIGCPFCFSVNTVVAVCDEYGCEKVAKFGYPTNDGYKTTCGAHMWKYGGKVEEVTEIHRLENKIEKLEADLKEAQKGAVETQVTK